jgi:DNA polymerase-3 subunit delta
VLYLYHGADDYSMRAALQELRARIAGDDGDMLENDTVVLDGATLSPGELIAHATAVPFLSPGRIVIVEGLLRALGDAKGTRRKKPAADDVLEPWRRTAAQLGDPAGLPETTTLVFLEAELKTTNAAFTIFSPIARTVEFAPLRTGDLSQWIQQAATNRGMRIDGHATAALGGLIGPDLWALSNELERLGTYADGETVTRDMVLSVTSAARAAKVWDLTDAIVAGDESKALQTMQNLVVAGEPRQMLMFMVVRQFRQLVVVKDMTERRLRRDEIARAAGLPGFRMDPMTTLAQRYSWDALRRAYTIMLDADLSVKRGLSEDGPALQVAIHELCALAPRSAARRPAAARR